MRDSPIAIYWGQPYYCRTFILVVVVWFAHLLMACRYWNEKLPFLNKTSLCFVGCGLFWSNVWSLGMSSIAVNLSAHITTYKESLQALPFVCDLSQHAWPRRLCPVQNLNNWVKAVHGTKISFETKSEVHALETLIQGLLRSSAWWCSSVQGLDAAILTPGAHLCLGW